jgi:hypothetical protein
MFAALTPWNGAVAQVSVASDSVEFADYYAWVNSISIGPVDWITSDSGFDEETLPPETVRGEFWRIAIASAEESKIYYVERITMGSEGCCMRVASAERLETYSLADRLDLPITVSFAPVRWTSPHSYIFEAEGRQFEIRGLGTADVTAVEINK